MFRSIYVWSDIWQTAGYSAVSIWRRSAGVDPRLYEAAKVDGASRFQKIRHVDLPGILPTIIDYSYSERRQHYVDRLRENLSAAKSAEHDQFEDYRDLCVQIGLLKRQLQLCDGGRSVQFRHQSYILLVVVNTVGQAIIE